MIFNQKCLIGLFCFVGLLSHTGFANNTEHKQTKAIQKIDISPSFSKKSYHNGSIIIANNVKRKLRGFSSRRS